jgi:hypothetical protein
MTMTNHTSPVTNNSPFQFSKKEALLIVDLLMEKIHDNKAEVITGTELTQQLGSCYALLGNHREVLKRIEEYKKVLGTKELSKEMILTAINGGQFPATEEVFKKSEKYYARFFASPEVKPKTPRPNRTKAKPEKQEIKTATDQNPNS